MHPLFVRIVATALCGSLAGVSPARADDTGARMMMGLFGAVLNEAQQQKQRPQQSDIQSRPQDSVEWDNPKSSKNAVNSAERTKTKKIQAALKTLGYYKSSIDGLPGPTTSAAIKAWQTQVGQEPDGVITDDQMEMLALAATVKQESAPNGIQAVAPDDFQALQARAEQGDAKAQNELGRLYSKGGGNVTRDDALAAAWYRKAAEQGNADAQMQLGISYDLGQGVPKDVTEAVEWYRKAAEQGHANAQNNMGSSYADGEGVPQDLVEAERWYRLAADQGNAAAKQNLAKLKAQKVEIEQREKKALIEQSLSNLPTCSSEAAVDALKDVLGERLIDWDPSSFCENGIGKGARECVGHVTLTKGEIRIFFQFKQAKSDPNKFLTQVEEIPSDYDLSGYRNDARAIGAAFRSVNACDRKGKE